MKNKKAVATKIIGAIVALLAIIIILGLYTFASGYLRSVSMISYGVESKYDEVDIKNYFFEIDFSSSSTEGLVRNEYSFQALAFERYISQLEESTVTEKELDEFVYQNSLLYLNPEHSDKNLPIMNPGAGGK